MAFTFCSDPRKGQGHVKSCQISKLKSIFQKSDYVRLLSRDSKKGHFYVRQTEMLKIAFKKYRQHPSMFFLHFLLACFSCNQTLATF